MSKSTNTVFQSGMWQPVSIQHNRLQLQIEGELPVELKGTYYRNGPNPFILNEPGYHQFDGDGMLHRIDIGETKAFYTNKWIETEKFHIESHFNKKVFYYYREYIEKYAGKTNQKGKGSGPANTNVVFFNNKLFVLHESSAPIEIDADTLKTVKKWDFLGNESWQTMTAHPKICPITHELNTYSYDPFQKELIYYRLDRFGKLINFFKVDIPYTPLLVHDFAITNNYIIFMLFPLVIEPSSVTNKIYDIAWRQTYQTQLMVYNKKSGERVCDYSLDAFFSYHFINAYQKEDHIIIDLFIFEGEMNSEKFWEPFDKTSYPHRIKINIRGKELHLKQLSDLSGEFATIDQQYIGNEYTKFYMCASTYSQRHKYEYNAIAEFNLITNSYQCYDFGENACCSEPLLVHTFSEVTQTFKYFLLTFVYDKYKDLSQLAIFISDKIEQGPICRLHIGARIPFGFHGIWVGKQPILSNLDKGTL